MIRGYEMTGWYELSWLKIHGKVQSCKVYGWAENCLTFALHGLVIQMPSGLESSQWSRHAEVVVTHVTRHRLDVKVWIWVPSKARIKGSVFAKTSMSHRGSWCSCHPCKWWNVKTWLENFDSKESCSGMFSASKAFTSSMNLAIRESNMISNMCLR